MRQVACTALFAFLVAAAPPKPTEHSHADDVDIRASGVHGSVMVNVAAGNSNQQVNAGALAVDVGASSARLMVHQQAADAPDTSGNVAAHIAEGSFANSNGWLAINGAAGSANQQANLAIIAIGATGAALSDTALSQARASHGPSGEPSQADAVGDRTVAIGNGAFVNSSGLIQVSLIGGDRNSSANSFALSSGSTEH